ncbi:hypothetical protein CBF58_00215 [Lactobacillus taiwanensis]|uniref:Uncharacterized protein n=2 Tax=Lactobacillus taiwanensis TaxID=508451 RepID=A0A256LLP5_9LACO|nr:hypothetical protein [Lactobacillus taiwanensis]OYR89120.1 hypothetical protein CBF53_00180 [Lactobacillus taiwanensis]OYR89301.1 hypothetical protein CBF59_11740 [Lactobacillus taiwanensis]OYR93442.1 hypothetical protein CBF70_00180 [Lactobacillus taiwanensis]OYR97636.1 hypothetical protein CBF58_00215 [Lactobacillus taiwanensis]
MNQLSRRIINSLFSLECFVLINMAVSKSKIPAELIFFDEILYLFFRIEISEFDKENREINVGVGYCWAQKNAA